MGSIAAVVTLCLADVAPAQSVPASQSASPWYVSGRAAIEARLARRPAERARNVILFVGDGMGVPTLTAARIRQGQKEGRSGEEGFLAFERFPYSALVKTYTVDAQVPDSAGTMTAMMSGLKTDSGVLGVDESVRRGTCAGSADAAVASAFELAELRGIATGVVTTTRVTHATPAAAYASSPERFWEDDTNLTEEARAAGCEDIASQLVRFAERLSERYPDGESDGIDVIMGGGLRHFLPRDGSPDAAAGALAGEREDGRDLVAEWRERNPGGTVATDRAGFDALASARVPVLALLADSHLPYEFDRQQDPAAAPSLAEMTARAIALLATDEDGFLLVVESGRIDQAHHAVNAYRALEETIALSDAVRTAVDATRSDETLILVTADHGHVLSLIGRTRRGNPILGKAVDAGADTPSAAADGLPYTTLVYANGPGQPGRRDLDGVDTTAPDYQQEVLVPLPLETHGGEDVALHARGPGAHRAHGVIEQHQVFHIIDRALGLGAGG